MNKKNSTPDYQKRALLLCFIFGLLVFFSILWMVMYSSRSFFYNPEDSHGGETASLLYADIYQNGSLQQTICLSQVTESYTFTIYGEADSFNQIEVHPGSIGILSASCPDKLCVHQGFIHDSLLPITCLPNRLVIQLRQKTVDEVSDITPDIITY